MDANRKMLEKQLEVMFDELAVADTEEEKAAITKRIETFYTLHQKDLEHDDIVEASNERKTWKHKIGEGFKFALPYIFGGIVFIGGLVFEETGALTSKSFKEARDKFFPRPKA